MSKFSKYSLIPIHIIILATQGEPSALQYVLKKYHDYILKLSLQNIYKICNNKESINIDIYMFRQLESKLMEKILKFDITR